LDKTKPLCEIELAGNLSPKTEIIEVIEKTEHDYQKTKDNIPKTPDVEFNTVEKDLNQLMKEIKPKLISFGESQYFRLRMIGRGGSSKVYQALSPTGELVALKKVSLDNSDPEIINGYFSEIKLLNALQNSEWVVKLKEYFSDSKSLFIVLELGEVDLHHYLKQVKGKPAVIYNPMVKIKSLHDFDYIHCDLKPANFILIGGFWKIIDFGISKRVEKNHTSVIRESQVGTVSYMSPEMIIDSQNRNNGVSKIGKPADIWSIGCILYQFVYGQPPFSHIPSLVQRIKAIIDDSFQIKFNEKPEMSVLIDITKKILVRHTKSRPTIEDLINYSSNF
ncbi:kinase-like protein, partial [Rozella allomycis CSF55]